VDDDYIDVDDDLTNVSDELLETFKAKYSGRGVWYTIFTLVSCLILNKFRISFPKHFQLKTIHLFFMIYCQNIYCLICRHHAADFMLENPKDLSSAINYFKWLYKFHKAANINSGKTSPSYSYVERIYLGEEGDTMLNYHDCQVGIWHFFFIVSTKCTNRGQIVAFYYIILEFMCNTFPEQSDMFKEFSEENKFTDALSMDNIDDVDLCMIFFEWLYALYSFINTRSNEKVYDIETIKNTYYNLEYCTESCDK
jgi:hypothetical protein